MIYSAPVCASLVDAATSLKRVVVLFYLSFTIFCAFEKFRLPTMSYIKPSSADGVTPTMNCTSGLYEVSREHLSFRKRLSALRLADSRVLLLVFVRYVLGFFLFILLGAGGWLQVGPDTSPQAGLCLMHPGSCYQRERRRGFRKVLCHRDDPVGGLVDLSVALKHQSFSSSLLCECWNLPPPYSRPLFCATAF